ncbi:phage head completion protein [Pseudogemmobacter faecipullorum]|uniref:Head-tail adaptor protein n=1 Tax=Pseudogemmobacter faecipullorum TaxID=2755041 RepID=A0ABS8CQ54_9RHOB|nr:head-tail adaptor protein [Pseudogemmobacter faecipullorum]MCB5411313.1 head-tail adaptor protein [Pseudogemmobacter faecipullorum]
MATAGDLHERFSFDRPDTAELPGGVTKPGWVQAHQCRAQTIYRRGTEVVEASRGEGRAVFKLRIRQCSAARSITPAYRARDLRRGLPAGETGDPLPGTRYNITEVDAISDRQWIFIVIEGGKAA